jgi:hypothetical protein
MIYSHHEDPKMSSQGLGANGKPQQGFETGSSWEPIENHSRVLKQEVITKTVS